MESDTVLHRTGERWWESETYRLRGMLMVAQDGEFADAEACFQQAREVARRSDAKSFELRAAMSLGRLWQQHGKAKEARRLPDEIYHRLTEGLHTADLEEAENLLEDLRSSTDVPADPIPD